MGFLSGNRVRTGLRLSVVLAFCFLCAAPQAFGATVPGQAERPTAFREIWGYLSSGEERFLAAGLPVSDVGYFGAAVNSTGHLSGVPARSLLSGFTGRVHLVVAEIGNKALTHFCLDPSLPIRDALISEIAAAAADYDGVQIDFEAVLSADGDNFIAFLRALHAAIGERTLSVAVPARTRKVDDSYDYERIAKVADRVIVMAYDEHWSGSPPGSIASLDWCSRVSKYAMKIIGKDKLVMGMPFYGRAWTDTNPAKAYRYSTLNTLISDMQIPEFGLEGGSPFFEYEQTVKVRVFFEDAQSVSRRARLYRGESVRNVSFWKLGQEDPDVWKYVALAN